MSKPLTPSLRFRGFEEEWESIQFNEAFTLLKNNTLSRASLGTSEEGVKNIHYGDVLIKYGAMVDCQGEEVPTIVPGCEPDLQPSVLLQNGDIIFADTAEDEAVGKCTEVRNIQENVKIVSGLHTIPVRPQSSFAKGFLGYSLNANAYHDTLKPLMQGIKVLSISKAGISNTFFAYPSTEEQGAIGDYFQRIDALIAEAQSELDRLEKMKLASLQNMFPRPGHTTPQIRFKGFDGEWVKKTLGKCFEEGTERGKYENLLSVGIQRGVYPTEDFVKTHTVTDFSKYKTVEVGDIVYNSMRMWQGASGYSAFSGIVSPAYTVLKPLENVYSPFFSFYFKLPWLIKLFELNSQGLTKDTWNLKYPSLAPIEIFVPENKEEQEIIAKYLENLNALIAEKRERVTKLRNIKKACLDRMFVNSSEL